ncbi:hypothetical protein DFH11DRAFT_513647 [Phellopilus nigrolimitatus]|nr:hypothetical protein DFH11DRAFT_900900 [Phellopilus nigrolimitatus]KAH8112215.1 hypothetical protein DFH11DRAFT_513647 [Phellopilus nigrolimitatus]
MHFIRSDVEPVDPSLVPISISEIDISIYTEVAILTLLVYDMFITMDKETKYFWSSPSSFVSLVYFSNRYIGIFGSISAIVYNTLQANETFTFWFQELANKRLAACLRTLFGLEAAFTLGVIIYDTIYEEIIVKELAKGVTSCGTNRGPPNVWDALSWAAPMVYAVILMVLSLYKAAEHWRETAGFSQFTLVKVLIQDQAIYFIMVIFCSVMQIVADQLYIPNALLAELLNVLGNPSLLCVLGSRLLVHLKEAGERGANGGTSYRMRTMSNIEFS